MRPFPQSVARSRIDGLMTKLSPCMTWCSVLFLLTAPCAAQVSDEQKNLVDKPLSEYRNCLFPKAIQFARASNEPADVIRQATLASCYRERDAAVAALKMEGLTDADIGNIDDHVNQQLFLAIISARAHQ